MRITFLAIPSIVLTKAKTPARAGVFVTWLFAEVHFAQKLSFFVIATISSIFS